MNVRSRIAQLIKSAGSMNMKYEKKNKPDDYMRKMKGKKKAYRKMGTHGTSRMKEQHYRLKTKQAQDYGFADGFIDLLEYAGFTKKAAIDTFEKVALELSPLQLGLGGAGVAGLGALGGLGLGHYLGGRDEEDADMQDQAIQPPDQGPSPEDLQMLMALQQQQQMGGGGGMPPGYGGGMPPGYGGGMPPGYGY